jgi:hypothetical protein
LLDRRSLRLTEYDLTTQKPKYYPLLSDEEVAASSKRDKAQQIRYYGSESCPSQRSTNEPDWMDVAVFLGCDRVKHLTGLQFVTNIGNTTVRPDFTFHRLAACQSYFNSAQSWKATAGISFMMAVVASWML